MTAWVIKRYFADDGIWYQCAVPEISAGPAGGDMPDAFIYDPVFPALWLPRILLVKYQGVAGEDQYSRVPCNEVNPAWLTGPGASIMVGLADGIVTKCIGERRGIAS